EGPSEPEPLARTLDAPLGTLEDLLEDFVAAKILVRTTEPDGVLLARAPDQLTVVDVLDAIREPPASYDVDPVVVPGPVAAALGRRDDVVRGALGSVTLRALASATDTWSAEGGQHGGPAERRAA
ncbi:MAG TPA: hypothetical protein VFQ62_07415, partial [Methylomirabilota bacterium]|nr:hypothetical protein [Methylomirabilota bacterium]